MPQKLNMGLGRLIVGVPRSHTITYTAGTTPLNERSARRRGCCLHKHNKHTRRTSTHSAGFESAIPAGKRPQTYAL